MFLCKNNAGNKICITDSNNVNGDKGQDKGDHGIEFQDGEAQGHDAGNDDQREDRDGETDCFLVFAHNFFLLRILRELCALLTMFFMVYPSSQSILYSLK